MSGYSTVGLQYLNTELMDAVDASAFRARQPYPWLNPVGMIRAEKLPGLIEEMPPLDRFTPSFGYERKYSQGAHDRYILEYTEALELSSNWRQFITELRGDYYRDFVRRLLAVRSVKFSFQWHYTPRGASVSPHVDSRRKIGTQIFI